MYGAGERWLRARQEGQAVGPEAEVATAWCAGNRREFSVIKPEWARLLRRMIQGPEMYRKC